MSERKIRNKKKYERHRISEYWPVVAQYTDEFEKRKFVKALMNSIVFEGNESDSTSMTSNQSYFY